MPWLEGLMSKALPELLAILCPQLSALLPSAFLGQPSAFLGQPSAFLGQPACSCSGVLTLPCP